MFGQRRNPFSDLFLGLEVEEITNEEFPFENFNNMTSVNELILLKEDQAMEYSGIGVLLDFL